MMKNLNIPFTDEEHAHLESKKKESGLSWHDFFLNITSFEAKLRTSDEK